MSHDPLPTTTRPEGSSATAERTSAGWEGVRGPVALVPLVKGGAAPTKGAAEGEPAFEDRYRVTGLLGAGSYAEVFRAVDRVTGEEVALKMLHDRVSDSAIWPARERFEREIAVMRQLNHPGVVPIRDSGMMRDPLIDGAMRPALVMPVVRGRTLATVIEGGERWSVGEVAEFLRETVGVLVHMQAHDVVHRDLGPQNIFLADEGERRFRIGDFGMARPLDAAVVTRLSGTLTEGMMARLVYTDAANRGGVVTSASDLVSLARIALALLRGRHYAGPLKAGAVEGLPAALRELLNRQALDGAEGEPARFLDELERALVAPDGAEPAPAEVRQGGGGGFTLIELFIVVLLIGVMAALVMPRFGRVKEQAYVAVMQHDLKSLSVSQEMYYADQMSGGGEGSYAPSVEALDFFETAPGVRIARYEQGGEGAQSWWRAEVQHEEVEGRICWIFQEPGSAPAAPTCTER